MQTIKRKYDMDTFRKAKELDESGRKKEAESILFSPQIIMGYGLYGYTFNDADCSVTACIGDHCD